MTVLAITGMGLTGVLRLTRVQDNLAHIMEHCEIDEPSGTWTGQAGPDYGLALGADVDNAVLQQLAGGSEIADLIWEAPDELIADHTQVFHAAIGAYHAGDSERAEQHWQDLRAIWSHAWSANYAVLELMQGTGLTRLSPLKPQRWVIASFEHHTSPHGLPRPHVHNIVIGGLTTGV
jgi:hypothetical protein